MNKLLGVALFVWCVSGVQLAQAQTVGLTRGGLQHWQGQRAHPLLAKPVSRDLQMAYKLRLLSQPPLVIDQRQSQGSGWNGFFCGLVTGITAGPAFVASLTVLIGNLVVRNPDLFQARMGWGIAGIVFGLIGSLVSLISLAVAPCGGDFGSRMFQGSALALSLGAAGVGIWNVVTPHGESLSLAPTITPTEKTVRVGLNLQGRF